MGQKTSPTGFRLAIRKDWSSIWIAPKKTFGRTLVEDFKIRDFLMNKPACLGTSDIIIKRTNDKLELTIRTARPGLVIGKKGSEIEKLKTELKAMTGKDVWIEIEEIKRPDLDAKLVAENISRQITRRVSFRKALKKAIAATMDAGALGVKVQISGRLGGTDIARSEWYKEGKIPLHTLRANIDYNTARAETTYGSIGIKVWVNKSDDTKR